MGINRGKQFEQIIQNQFEQLSDISVDRLYDVTTGFKNQNTVCDLIVYKKGTLNYFECKAIHGNTLNFKSHIRKNQWDKLMEKSFIPGVNAGIICWFVDNDSTLFLDIEEYRLLNGWSQDKKKGSCRYDRIPVQLMNEITLSCPQDYMQLLPNNLPDTFTCAEFAKLVKIPSKRANVVLNILTYLDIVERIGKKGNAYIYKAAEY